MACIVMAIAANGEPKSGWAKIIHAPRAAIQFASEQLKTGPLQPKLFGLLIVGPQWIGGFVIAVSPDTWAAPE